MKNFSILIITISIFITFLSCNKNEADTTPPGKLTVNEVFPTYGGAKITYTLPDDNDILYVKATYTNDLGKRVFKVSSYYNDTIEVDGFVNTEAKSIDLQVVDKEENHSEITSVTINPWASYIFYVKESLKVAPTLGGAIVTWTNVLEKTAQAKVYFEYDNHVDSIYMASNSLNFTYQVEGLDSMLYNVSAVIQDFPGNSTGNFYIGQVKPAFEEIIDKSTWTLVSNLSVDGNAYEGVTENFWDDVIDTNDDASDNSYFIINRDNNGGALNYPLDIVIDLGKKVKINRLRVWQRAYWYSGDEPNGVSVEPYYYQQENLKNFSLYISNDLENWTHAGDFEINDALADEVISEEELQAAIDGHPFNLDEPTAAFQYLKFSITSSFGSEINVYGSELTLYGLDNVNP